MIYAIVTDIDSCGKIQFNVDKFIVSYPLYIDGNDKVKGTKIIVDDGDEGFHIHSKEYQENIFDNIIEIYGG